MRKQVLANLLALAAICPFVGSLSDILGRRYLALIGASLLIIGLIVASTATVMDNFIGMEMKTDAGRTLTTRSGNGDFWCWCRH
jgi:MFS family permease